MGFTSTNNRSPRQLSEYNISFNPKFITPLLHVSSRQYVSLFFFFFFFLFLGSNLTFESLSSFSIFLYPFTMAIRLTGFWVWLKCLLGVWCGSWWQLGPWLIWLNQGHWVFFGFLCEELEDFPFGFLSYQTLNEDEIFFSFPF